MKKTERKFIGVKDLILSCLLGCLLLVVAVLVATFAFPLGILMSSIVGLVVPAILGGIIYVLMMTKSPRHGTHFVLAAIFAIFYIASGSLITGILICIAGIIGELTMIGAWKKKWRPLIPYTIHWLAYTFAGTLQLLFMKESMIKTFMGMGMDKATATATIDNIASVYGAPLNMVAFTICCLAASALGYYIGVKALHKHFKAAGIA